MEMSAQIMMMGGASAAGGDNFIANYAVSGRNFTNYGVDFDDSDNIVSGGLGPAAIGTADGYVVKTDNSGTILWSKAVGFGSVSSSVQSVAFDSNGDVIVGAESTEPGYGGKDVVILKLSGADGSITWQRELGTAGADTPTRVIVDPSDNIYAIITLNANASSCVAKWNSSGALQWQRTMSEAGSTYGRDLAVDSSGNVYVAGEGDTSGKGFIAKYNSSGTIQWQYVLNNSQQAIGIEVDGSGNIYVLSETSAGTFNEITKLSSTPTVTWTRKITGGSGSGKTGGVALDSSNNVYITFIGTVGATGGVIFAKYNNSGTIQWQRSYAYTTTVKQNNVYGIKIDNTDTILLAIRTTSVTIGSFGDGVVIRAANDGSGTGVYGANTYAATTKTEAAGSVTLTASSLTEAAGAATEAAGNLSVAASGISTIVQSLV